ncbi:MAG: polysaccharide pyruvyl transferase family protein [Defluviitaleaceae bacterium]|nr:polysaccharide pyruvyl transferase family protein [Defluviitaleaceae bacterium]
MKVSVMTIIGIENYGSVLQAFATQKKLEEYADEAELFNYVQNTSPADFAKDTKNPIKKFLLRITLKRFLRNFCDFKKNLNLSEKKYITDFAKFESDADIYCVGSDQIWNPDCVRQMLPDARFLGFVPETERKFSFSSSFGKEIPDENFVSETKNMLHQFEHISVREDTGVEILKNRYNYHNVTQLVDPTLAMPPTFWRKYASPKRRTDYILIFTLARNKKLDDFAKKLSKKTGLQIVRLCTKLVHALLPGKAEIIPTYFEFVTLIDNAKYVLTDSFHGTAFSLNLNTEFIVFAKNNPGRILSLLRLSGAEHRMISDAADLSILNRPTDFAHVNEILARERERVDEFLRKVFSGIANSQPVRVSPENTLKGEVRVSAISRPAAEVIKGVRFNCTGCGACRLLCPANCIESISDDEGFLVAKIDATRCTDCGLCAERCPANSPAPETAGNAVAPPIETGDCDIGLARNNKVIGARYKNDDILKKSASGGVFAGIADMVISTGGAVFGCAFDENFTARHICITDSGDIEKCQSSKYVQSDTGDTFAQAKSLLNAGKTVFYTGCPCQIAGLYAYLGENRENLLTADLICHGVPSPLLFKKNLARSEKKLGDKITYFNFRSKDAHGHGIVKIKTATKTVFSEDAYYNAFLQKRTQRESCYVCPYASPQRVGDITLGDFWGLEHFHPEFADTRGVSVVTLNTEKGEKFFSKVRDRFEIVKSSFENAAFKNVNLRAPSPRPSLRDSAYRDIDADGEIIFSGPAYKKKTSIKSCIKRMIPPTALPFLKRVYKKLTGMP